MWRMKTPGDDSTERHAGSQDDSTARDQASRQQRIDAFMAKVQALDPRSRWFYETDSLNLALALGEQPDISKKSRQVLKALTWVHRLGLATPIVTVASLVLLGRLLVAHWVYQARRPRQSGISHTGVFISIGVLRESVALAAFRRLLGTDIRTIDERCPQQADWGGVIDPRLAWREWRASLTWILAARRRGELVGFSDALFLLHCLRLLPYKVYYSVGFGTLRTKHQGAQDQLAVCCVTPSTSAFAAVESGFHALFYQHGFLARSLVFPDFDMAYALTMPEAEHIQARIPRACVVLAEHPSSPLRPTRTLALAGVYAEVREQDQLEALMTDCRAQGVRIVVRPSPKDRTGYWARWQGVLGIDFDAEGDFDAFLSRHRPCVLASWASTTLFDALSKGVIPLNIGEIPDDMVLPLRQVALQWPDDQARLFSFFSNQEQAVAYLAARQTVIWGAVAGPNTSPRMLTTPGVGRCKFLAHG